MVCCAFQTVLPLPYPPASWNLPVYACCCAFLGTQAEQAAPFKGAPYGGPLKEPVKDPIKEAPFKGPSRVVYKQFQAQRVGPYEGPFKRSSTPLEEVIKVL